jgi:rod shape-determining protein MreC
MALPDIRQHAGVLFLVVAVGHIILISAQVNSRPGVPVLEAVVFRAFSEVQRAASGGIGAIAHVWTSYVALHDAARENEDLRRQLAATAVKLQELRIAAERSARLEALLGFRDRYGLPTAAANVVRTAAAEVIAGGPAPDLDRTVTIDVGTRDKVGKNMAVLAPAGVVGRVFTKPGPHTAKVQLLVDRTAAAAAVFAESREQGIVVGTSEDMLEMQYVAATVKVQPGDVVLTSGLDGIYPKGFVIGRVEDVETAGGVRRIRVRPAVNFAALDEVLVVLAHEEAGPAGRAALEGRRP